MTWLRVEIYAVNVWRAADVLVNAMLGGDRKQTISARIGDAARRNRKWAIILDRAFFGHFTVTVEESLGKQILVTSLGFALAAPVFLAWVWAGWHWPGPALRIIQVYLGMLFIVLIVALVRRKGRLP